MEGANIMTVAFDIDGFVVLKNLGIVPSDLVMLKNHGVEATVLPSGIKLSQDGVVLGAIGIKLAEVTSLAANKNIGSFAKKSVLLDMAQSVVHQVLKQIGVAAKGMESELHTPIGSNEDSPAAQAVKMEQAYQEASKAGKPVTVNKQYKDAYASLDVDLGSEESITSMAVSQDGPWKAVPLREAVNMYQPVRGSDASSVYFVVGLSPIFKVAARYRLHRLSVRVELPEGAPTQVCMDTLKQVGFSLGGSKSYASIHLQVDDPINAAKALGALLGGLGAHMLTPMPQLSVIADKGV